MIFSPNKQPFSDFSFDYTTDWKLPDIAGLAQESLELGQTLGGQAAQAYSDFKQAIGPSSGKNPETIQGFFRALQSTHSSLSLDTVWDAAWDGDWTSMGQQASGLFHYASGTVDYIQTEGAINFAQALAQEVVELHEEVAKGRVESFGDTIDLLRGSANIQGHLLWATAQHPEQLMDFALLGLDSYINQYMGLDGVSGKDRLQAFHDSAEAILSHQSTWKEEIQQEGFGTRLGLGTASLAILAIPQVGAVAATLFNIVAAEYYVEEGLGIADTRSESQKWKDRSKALVKGLMTIVAGGRARYERTANNNNNNRPSPPEGIPIVRQAGPGTRTNGSSNASNKSNKPGKQGARTTRSLARKENKKLAPRAAPPRRMARAIAFLSRLPGLRWLAPPSPQYPPISYQNFNEAPYRLNIGKEITLAIHPKTGKLYCHHQGVLSVWNINFGVFAKYETWNPATSEALMQLIAPIIEKHHGQNSNSEDIVKTGLDRIHTLLASTHIRYVPTGKGNRIDLSDPFFHEVPVYRQLIILPQPIVPTLDPSQAPNYIQLTQVSRTLRHRHFVVVGTHGFQGRTGGIVILFDEQVRVSLAQDLQEPVLKTGYRSPPSSTGQQVHKIIEIDQQKGGLPLRRDPQLDAWVYKDQDGQLVVVDSIQVEVLGPPAQGSEGLFPNIYVRKQESPSRYTILL